MTSELKFEDLMDKLKDRDGEITGYLLASYVGFGSNYMRIRKVRITYAAVSKQLLIAQLNDIGFGRVNFQDKYWSYRFFTNYWDAWAQHERNRQQIKLSGQFSGQ